MDPIHTIRKEARKDLFRMGCAGATYKALNSSFGYVKEAEVKAIAPLCGGILQKGYQCGMIWGAALAAGTASFSRYGDIHRATSMAMLASGELVRAFAGQSKSIDCRGITGCDWTTRWGAIRYFISGKIFTCRRLIGRWTTAAIESANTSFSGESNLAQQPPLSCSFEVVKKMGGSDEQAVMVAGFAGGIGLSGNACGALGAAIWMLTLRWQKENPKKNAFKIPEALGLLKAFEKETHGEYLCHRITGKNFGTVGAHTEFIRDGGCRDLMQFLAGT